MTRRLRVFLHALVAALGIAAEIVVNYATATGSLTWWILLAAIAVVVVVIVGVIQGLSSDTLGPGPTARHHHRRTLAQKVYDSARHGWIHTFYTWAVALIVVSVGLGVGWVAITVGGVKVETLPRIGRNLLLRPVSGKAGGLTVSVDQVYSWGNNTKVTMSLYNNTPYDYVLNEDMCHLHLPDGRTLVGRGHAPILIYAKNRIYGTSVFDEVLPLDTARITISWVHLNASDADEVVVRDIPLRS